MEIYFQDIPTALPTIAALSLPLLPADMITRSKLFIGRAR
jgi:hypothetical protein